MVYTIIQTAKSVPKGPKTKLSLVKWPVFHQNLSDIQINSILLIKKGRSLRGKKSAFTVFYASLRILSPNMMSIIKAIVNMIMD